MQNKLFGFLLFDGFEDLDFFGPWEIFGIWNQLEKGPKVITISENKEVTSAKGLSIKANASFTDCPKLDYLLIPGGMGTRKEVNNTHLINFIKKKSKETLYVLSVCTGAFLLQKASLLNQKKATTHFASINRLKEFTEVKVTEERYTHDGNIWTSAGISSGIDMSLAFVASIAGEKIAGIIQQQAEYFPDGKIYHPNLKLIPKYVKLP